MAGLARGKVNESSELQNEQQGLQNSTPIENILVVFEMPLMNPTSPVVSSVDDIFASKELLFLKKSA